MKNKLLTRILATILWLTAALLMTPSAAFALDMSVGAVFQEDGLTYQVLSLPLFPHPGTVQVGDGISPVALTSGDVVIPETVAGGLFRVTAIGGRAFESSIITSVDMPDSVTAIGYRAFFGCGRLASVTIPDGVSVIWYGTFANCIGLTSVTIGSGVREIASPPTYWGGRGDGAFEGCTKLTEVTIPGNVKTIGAAAFKGCAGLRKVALGNGVETIGGYIFTNWFALAEQAGAFGGCVNLASVNLPQSLTSIQAGAFEECRELMGIVIPANVTSIGSRAFYACVGLTTLVLPDGIESIGHNSFSSCSKLRIVEIPQSLTSIGSDAFYSCGTLARIDVHEQNPVYSSEQGVLFDRAKTLIQYPIARAGNYDIPEGVITVGGRAFAGCIALSAVTIPKSVTSIGEWAFYGCAKLTTVKIPGNVSSIGNLAFRNSGLTAIEIQPGVKTIGSMAFAETGLSSVVLPKTLTRLGSMAFVNCYRLSMLQFNSRDTTIDLPTIYDHGQLTIPYQTKIRCYYPSTAIDYVVRYGNPYELLDLDPVGDVLGNIKTKKPVLVLVAGLESNTGRYSGGLGAPWDYLGSDDAKQKLGVADILVMPTMAGDGGGLNVINSTGPLDAATYELAVWLNSSEVKARTNGHPIILVGHSYGGVIARSMLAAGVLGDPVLGQIAGIVQFGSPNGGSQAAETANVHGTEILTGIWESAATHQLTRAKMAEWNRDNRGWVEVPVVRFGGQYLPDALDVYPNWWDPTRAKLIAVHKIMDNHPSDGNVSSDSLENGIRSLGVPSYDFGDGAIKIRPRLAHAPELPGVGESAGRLGVIVPQTSAHLFFHELAAAIAEMRLGWTSPDAPTQSGSLSTPVPSQAAVDDTDSTFSTAHLPVHKATVAANRSTSVNVVLDQPTSVIVFSALDTATVSVRDSAHRPLDVLGHSTVSTAGAITVLEVTPTTPGVHTFDVSLPPGVSGDITLTGVAAGGAQLSLSAGDDAYAGEESTMTAVFMAVDGAPLVGGSVSGSARLGGQEVPLTFVDDGTGADSAASDGVYTAPFVAPVAGRWIASVEAIHSTAERAGVLVVDVGERVATVTGPLAVVTPAGPGATFASFGVEVPLSVSADGTYTVSAMVTDETGERVGLLRATAHLAALESTSLVPALLQPVLTGDAPRRLVVAPIRVTRESDGIELMAGTGPGLTTSASYTATDFYTFSVSLNGPTANPSPTGAVRFSGTALNTASTVLSVEYSIDAATTWHPVAASDGAFDSQSEEFTIDLDLPDYVYGIHVRQTGADGTVLPVGDWAGVRFTIDTVPPAGVVGLLTQVTSDDGTHVAKASWLSVDPPSDTTSVVRYAITLDGVDVGTTYDTNLDINLPDALPHTLTVTPIDAAGNRGPTSSQLVRADTTAPVTLSDAILDYVDAATITLSPVDDLSGVAQTLWWLGSDSSTATSGAVATVSGAGTYELSFLSIDHAGNREETQTIGFVITPSSGGDTMPVAAPTINGPATSNDGANIRLFGTADSNVGINIVDEHGSLVGLAIADLAGNWQATVNLPLGTWLLSAEANKNGFTGPRSVPHPIVVSPIVPAVGDGTASQWGNTYTANPATGVVKVPTFVGSLLDIAVPVSGNPVAVSVEYLGATYPLTDPDGDGIYTTSLLTGFIGWGTWTPVTISILTGDGSIYEQILMEVTLIDPSGYVYDALTNARVVGATVTLYTADGAKWDPTPYNHLKHQINPQVTDDEGRYGWDVPEGGYYVVVTRDGYFNHTSRTVLVPPPVLDLDIALTPKTATKLEYVGTEEVQYSDVAMVSVRLTDAVGNPLAGKAVAIEVAPGDSEVYTTASDGTASRTVHALAGASMHSVKASFLEDDDYLGSIFTGTFAEVAERASLTYTGDVFAATANGMTLKARVAGDDDGSAGDLSKINPASVKFYLSNTDGTALTPIAATAFTSISAGGALGNPETGEFSVTTNLPVGVYNIVVKLETNGYYTAPESAAALGVSYDPSGGFATGGGWLKPDIESTLPDGRANFGFVAKYKDSSSTGNLEFQYQDANINLKSKTIDWLAISDKQAQFQGTATMNGQGLYTFRVMAKDNGEPGADVDSFDIRIWQGTNTEAALIHRAKNTIVGGNIVVRKK